MSKHNPITTRLYAITRDTFPGVEDQLIKLKSKSQETQRALLSAIASGIAMVEIVNAALDHGIDIAPCKNDANVLARNLQGRNGTGIARDRDKRIGISFIGVSENATCTLTGTSRYNVKT